MSSPGADMLEKAVEAEESAADQQEKVLRLWEASMLAVAEEAVINLSEMLTQLKEAEEGGEEDLPSKRVKASDGEESEEETEEAETL